VAPAVLSGRDRLGSATRSRRRIFRAVRRAPDEHPLLALLKVDEEAPWDDVRRAFRDAVRESHPDLHPGDADAERRLKALNAAWESINTPSKWAAYRLQPAPGPMGGSSPPGRTGAAVASVGRLRVQRHQRGSPGLLNWKLEVDGTVAASIENGGVAVLEASPGRHSLRVFYGSRSSLPLRVDLQRGQELLLGCRGLDGLRTSLFSRERSLVLELLESRWFE
jgi:hypothetical protein